MNDVEGDSDDEENTVRSTLNRDFLHIATKLETIGASPKPIGEIKRCDADENLKTSQPGNVTQLTAKPAGRK
jgi:hypothetical protein